MAVAFQQGGTPRQFFLSSPEACTFSLLQQGIEGGRQMAVPVQSEQWHVLAMADQAHLLIDQFVMRENVCPERAWEALADLQLVLDQLRAASVHVVPPPPK